jgi:uncharacterized membrane protein
MKSVFMSLAITVFAVPALAEPLQCSGSAPLWFLDLGDESAVLTRPDRSELHFNIPHRTAAEGRSSPQALSLIGDRDSAIVILRNQDCREGADKPVTQVSVDILTQDKGRAILLTGCCRAP